jgi:hypothetical protein
LIKQKKGSRDVEIAQGASKRGLAIGASRLIVSSIVGFKSESRR